MSWGYWGIVSGILVLVTLFFFCLDLFYREPNTIIEAEKTGGEGARDTMTSTGTKHAA
ncbi:hypothetical protein [Candidatus Nitrospira bockiana]